MLLPFELPAVGELRSCSCIKRHPANPVLRAEDVPYRSSFAFNAGAVKYQGRYVMAFRNDVYEKSFREGGMVINTEIGTAFSDDGVTWKVSDQPCRILYRGRELPWCNDSRLQLVDGKPVLTFAFYGYHGVRPGIATTEDFQTYEVIHMGEPDNRNMVIFPEKIDGLYVRLDRPFPEYGRDIKGRFDIWYSKSPDLRFWGESELVLGCEDVPFCNEKLGPAAPPIKTDKGWLCIFHAVDTDPSRPENFRSGDWQKRYTAGVMLLDLNDPQRLIGLGREPLLVPEADYETKNGFRNNVIFPGAAILEDDGEVKIYYGAADTTECLATAKLKDLLDLIEPCSRMSENAAPFQRQKAV